MCVKLRGFQHESGLYVVMECDKEGTGIKSDMMEQISVCLARHAARAIARRAPLKPQGGGLILQKMLRDLSHDLEEMDEHDFA